jgi:hypothetical protein
MPFTATFVSIAVIVALGILGASGRTPSGMRLLSWRMIE